VHCNAFLSPCYAKVRFVLSASKVLLKRMLLKTCVLACKINMSGMLITRSVFMVIVSNETGTCVINGHRAEEKKTRNNGFR